MLPDPNSQKIRLRELTLKRKHLWERFKGNPYKTHLAAELKVVDDLIVICNQQIFGDCNKSDDAEQEVAPKVEQLFLLLGVFQRKQS